MDGLEPNASRASPSTSPTSSQHAQRSFILADTPGHEQYTRNMATGASNCDLAIILIDARKGVLTQTKRHSFICSLLGIRHLVVAVNKIDLVGYDQDRFDEIVADYRAFAKDLGFESVVPIPMSARFGENVTSRSGKMSWYAGPSLVDHLETIDVTSLRGQPFASRCVGEPAQLDFRGFSGTGPPARSSRRQDRRRRLAARAQSPVSSPSTATCRGARSDG